MKKAALIMAGGRGTRLWPISRNNRPKQFQAIGTDKPLIVETAERLTGLVENRAIFVVASEELLEIAKPMLPDSPWRNFIAEPGARDSGPGALLGTIAIASEMGDDAIVAMLPADHVIPDTKKYQIALDKAYEMAANPGTIVTFGIRPIRAETGYGYIEEGDLVENGDVPVSSAKRFVEKPDVHTAQEYLKNGNYFWNSGMFVWRAGTLIDAWREIRPAEAATIDELSAAYSNGDSTKLAAAFDKIEKVSLDYAIMEHFKNILLVKGQFRWDDVGSFDALDRTVAGDIANNIAEGDVHYINSAENIVLARGSRDIFILEAEGLVVIDTDDALLIYPKGKGQNIRDVVDYVKKHRDNLL